MPPGTLSGRVISALLVALCLTGCGSATDDTTTSSTAAPPITSPVATVASPLVGRWERTGGDFSTLVGMVVEVDELAIEGKILSVPRNPYQFVVGDVKWSNFTGVSYGRIRIRDLTREADTGLPSHITGVITLTPDGTMLEVRFPSTGTLQVWTRRP